MYGRTRPFLSCNYDEWLGVVQWERKGAWAAAGGGGGSWRGGAMFGHAARRLGSGQRPRRRIWEWMLSEGLLKPHPPAGHAHEGLDEGGPIHATRAAPRSQVHLHILGRNTRCLHVSHFPISLSHHAGRYRYPHGCCGVFRRHRECRPPERGRGRLPQPSEGAFKGGWFTGRRWGGDRPP